jgi:predicted O-methyltransferase YrrM
MATGTALDECQREGCGASEVVNAVSQIEGWLTDDQVHQLWHSASALPPNSLIVEIGSFRGRSTVALALASPDDVEIVAIDPHSGADRAPQQTALNPEAGTEDAEAFAGNLRRFGVTDKICHIPKPSSAALGDVPRRVDLLFIDGRHELRAARGDILGYGRLVAEGGTVLIHDSFSSIGVTLALISTLFSSRRFRYLGRTGSLTVYHRSDVSPLELVRSCGRQLAQLPWFARNIAIKVLILLRQEHLARALGHTTGPWPY